MPVEWAGLYRDESGAEPIVIHNDGVELRTVIRGTTFVSDDFETWEPLERPAADSGFTLKDRYLENGYLAAFQLDVQIPLPVQTDDGLREARLDCRLEMLPEQSVLSMKLRMGDSTYTVKRTNESFEEILRDLHWKMPARSYLKACIACNWSDYHPVGNPVFGGLACFRDNKDGYRRVRSKADLFAIWGSSPEFEWVQETYLCDQFERRGPDVGYRGSFPGQDILRDGQSGG
ncbi:DUF6304 family protein [Actinomadura rudentiformis]|uniref:Uncharacterized protein n=1 Tax=Actinomadura rudentiformis TaxID=359158 RepID=A0A6H9YFL0_9ACTN|nr:DUF6304 family protein [Actinomadura rudentiformis]KAB2343419.1 hypothetical protein F8566_35415 [Actinomadura rudentiformis]